jgi:biofilm PGA synthesis lipoprotein PgaB
MTNRKRSMAFSGALTAASAMLVAAYLVLPGMWQWSHAQTIHVDRHKLTQVETVGDTADPKLIERLRNTSTSPQAAPIILTYHDISYAKSQYSVTPETFATQMRMLHDAGWTTLTAAQLDDWTAGKALPPRSVVITFDDGTGSVWRYADPVLRRYNQHALAFIITGFIGTRAPYYMTWEQVGDLQRSGRWDLEAHTHVGHVFVPADNEGNEGPFLTTVMWLAEQHRFETDAEYHARVLGDLVECKRQFQLHDLPVPAYFAYPFSAHEADVTHETVLSLFRAGMLDDGVLIQMTSSEDMAKGLIRRMDVTWALSLEGLVRKIELASPLDPGSTDPLADPGGWTNSDQQPSNALAIDGKRITIDPGPTGQTSVQYSRIRTTQWTNYSVSADLVFDDHGTTTGISVFVGNIKHEVVLSVNLGYYSLSFGDSEDDISFGDLPEAGVYHVDITATPTVVTVAINGQQLPPIVLPPLREKGPPGEREVGGGIGLISHRAPDARLSVIDNLTVSR